MQEKVYVITRFEIAACSEHIVKIFSKKEDAKQAVDKLNKFAGEGYQYLLQSYYVDGDECYD